MFRVNVAVRKRALDAYVLGGDPRQLSCKGGGESQDVHSAERALQRSDCTEGIPS